VANRATLNSSHATPIGVRKTRDKGLETRDLLPFTSFASSPCPFPQLAYYHISLLFPIFVIDFKTTLMKTIKLIILVLAVILMSFVLVDRMEIPKTGACDHVVYHTGYALLYDEIHEQPAWVAYELTKEETVSQFKRENKFITDPDVKTGTATNADYAKSGYDRGHLAPAADMGWSEITMKESFYFSNMSPQRPEFNRGIWKKLEDLMRDWAVENEKIYIVTGPILTPGLPTIGHNQVSVPQYFYKVILDYTEPDIKGIGFILANEGSSQPLTTFAVSIDSVEKFSGLDFFPTLPDNIETSIEKNYSTKSWSWK